MIIAAIALLAAATVVPLLLNWRRLPHWLGPIAALLLLAAAAIAAVQGKGAYGFGRGAAAVCTVAAAMLGGIPLPPAAFRIARQQPDAGDQLPTIEGPLRGGRMIGILERAAIAAAILAGRPDGLAVIMAVKSLARYPDLRDSNVSEQFIIGTFSSVLWSVSVAAVGRHLVH